MAEPKSLNEIRNIFKDTLEDMMENKQIQGYHISNSDMGSIHIAIRTITPAKDINVNVGNDITTT